MALDIMAAFTNEPPELDFIWPGFLAGTVGALVAPGATGKSFFALEAAMSIACSVAGGDLVGLAPAHTGRVVYLAGEDPQPALVRRVHAIGQHLNQSAREAIAENLMLEPIMGKRLNVMDEAHLRRVIDYSAGARLMALLQRLAAVRGRLSLCADQAAAAKWWLSMPMASVSAEGPMPKALSTRRTSPLMPGCRHQGRACPLRRARMTSNPLIVA